MKKLLFLGILIFTFFLFYPGKGDPIYRERIAKDSPKLGYKISKNNSGKILPSIFLDTTCVGSVGEPIVNITFGSGSNFGSPLDSGITNLAFVNQNCPADGQYTLTNKSQACFNGAWQVSSDHTGNPNGYFMLINASFQPNDFYVQKVNNLCTGTTFEFSSWILNMITSRYAQEILPNITFSIEKEDGTVLKVFNTGPIPESDNPSWIKYGFYFTTPPGISTVILRLRNNAPGGAGNDIGLDDITFRPVGPLLNGQVEGFGSDSIIVCKGTLDSIKLNSGIESCSAPTNFQWQRSIHPDTGWTDISGATSSTYIYKIADTGLYYFRLAAAQDGNIGNPNCRFLSKLIRVGVYFIPQTGITISASRDSICLGDSVVLKAITQNPGNLPLYQWMVNGKAFGPDSVQFITHILKDQDQINCSLQSSLPCSPSVSSNTLTFHVSQAPVVKLPPAYFLVSSKSVQLNPQIMGDAFRYEWTPSEGLSNPNIPNPIASPLSNTFYQLKVETYTGCSVISSTWVYLIYDLDIPNIFSPNHDGINDTWNIKHLSDFPNSTLSVFNRYGQKVFNSVGYPNPWDGNYQGTPLPLATYYYIIDLKNGYKILSGSITLIR